MRHGRLVIGTPSAVPPPAGPAAVSPPRTPGTVAGAHDLVVSTIAISPLCVEHQQPLIGRAHIGYLCEQQIVTSLDLSDRLHRLAAWPQPLTQLAHRLAEWLHALSPTGAAVLLAVPHDCPRPADPDIIAAATEVSSAFRGLLRDLPSVRAEFLSLARSHSTPQTSGTARRFR